MSEIKALDKLRELYRFEENHREHIDSIEEVNRQLNERIKELQERSCPGYEPESHRCKWHDADFELNVDRLNDLKRENAGLKKRIEKLLACLVTDFGIRASWDGLRKVWLTEQSHAENAAETPDFAENPQKTPEQAIAATLGDRSDEGFWPSEDSFAAHLLGVTQRQDERIAALEATLNKATGNWAKSDYRNTMLEQLVQDMWVCVSETEDGDCTYCSRRNICNKGINEFKERMIELGLNV